MTAAATTEIGSSVRARGQSTGRRRREPDAGGARRSRQGGRCGAGREATPFRLKCGLLVHIVRINEATPDAPVARCMVIAPTEWNFHPRGVAARALADRPGDHALLVMALDPCVGYRVEGLGLPQNSGPAHEKGAAHA